MIDLECCRRKLQVFSKASLTSEPKLCFEEVFFGSKAFNKMKSSRQALHELVGGSTGKTVLAGASDNVAEG